SFPWEGVEPGLGPWAVLKAAGGRAADLVEGLLRQADRGQGAAEAAVPQLRRQRLRRGVAGGQLPAPPDRVPRPGPQLLGEADLYPLPGAGVELEAAGHRLAERLLHQ